MSEASFWNRLWYGDRRRSRWLAPLGALFARLAAGRRRRLQARARPVGVPVVVVGNITLGGTGKTPLIIALARRLREAGWRPGVVSRGYGGRAPAYPLFVTPHTPVAHCGDEPLIIASESDCPVCVAPDRVAAAWQLVAEGCDLILSDDGLQHYRLARELELAVVDGRRGLGNGRCLPAGPLREPASRLAEVDWVLVNDADGGRQLPSLPMASVSMALKPRAWHPVAGGEGRELAYFAPGTVVHAVAGIGHPERFFRTLESLGLEPERHAFSDHHRFRPADLRFADRRPLVMTAKDAVKCRAFAQPHWWYLSVTADLPESFWREFLARVQELGNPQ